VTGLVPQNLQRSLSSRSLLTHGSSRTGRRLLLTPSRSENETAGSERD
jgi:hypothetical protein